MVPLSDPIISAKIQYALSNWRYTGYVTWKAIARAWIETNLDGMTARFVAAMMFEHVAAGGEIDQVKETRLSGASKGSTTIFASQLGIG